MAMSQSPAAVPCRSTVSRLACVGLVILGGLCWLPGPGIALFVVPRFKEIFVKFDIKGSLPFLTQAIIAVSDVLLGYWFVFVPLWLLVVGGLAVWAGLAGSRRALLLAGIFAIIAIIATTVLVPVMVVGLFQPLTQMLIQSVGECR
jgi:hypothetical protein